MREAISVDGLPHRTAEKINFLIRSLIANVIEVVMTLVFGATATFRRSPKSLKRKIVLLLLSP